MNMQKDFEELQRTVNAARAGVADPLPSPCKRYRACIGA